MNHTKQKVLNYEGLSYFYNRLKEDLAPSKLVDQIDHLNATVAEIDIDITNLQDNKVDKVSGKGLSTNDYTTIEKTKLGATNIAYATCSTAAGTAAKVATVIGNTNWTLSAGSTISILFSNTNTAQNPTLNVNGTGAKNIYYENAQITTSNLGYAGTTKRVMTFVYDGTQYRFSAWGYDGNTNTYVRTYKDESGTYPILASRTAASSWDTTYKAVYGTIGSGITMTPSTATITSDKFDGTATYAIHDAGGNDIIETYITKQDLESFEEAIDGISTDIHNKQNANVGTSNRTLISGSDGKIAVSSITSTELGYLDNVTSNIQTQLNSKVDKVSGKGLSTNDFTSAYKTKLDNLDENQKAFSTIAVKESSSATATNIAADSNADTFTLIAGSNITLTPSTTDDSLTITSSYPSAAGSSLGLVKSGGDVNISNGTITVKDDSHSHSNYALGTTVSDINTRVETLEDSVEAIQKVVDISADGSENTIDTISEIIGYIQDNKDAISIITDKQNKNLGTSAASKVLVTDSSGNIAASSSISTTELGYLNNVTSNIQTQLNSKVSQSDYDTAMASKASTAVATTTANGLMSSSDKTKLNNIETGANKYVLPTASSTLGGVKTTSTVTSTSGLTACPIIEGVPYYKNSTYTVNNGTITLSAGAGLTGGGDFTLNQSSAETISFAHSNSVTAGTVSEGGSARTLAFGGTFKVPSVTYDAQGHITGTTTTTLTMPAAPTDNDKKVLQSSSTTSEFRPLVFGATRTADLSAITTEVTDQVFINEKFYAKPSEGRLFAKSITLTGEGVSNIQFTREGLNYIMAPATGSIGLGCADTVRTDTCTVILNSSSVSPGVTNTINLGSDTKRWKSIFTTEFNAFGIIRLSRADQWPTLNIYRTSQGTTPSATIAYEGSETNATSRIRFRAFSKNSADNMLLGSNYYEDYILPSTDVDRTNYATYAILTSKSPVTVAQGGTGGNSREVAWSNIVAAGGTFTGPITGTLNGNATSSSKTSLVEKEAANWTSFTWFGAKDSALSTSQHIGQANFLAVEGSGKRVNRFQFFSRSWDSTTGALLEYGRYAIIPSCPADLTATKYEYFILGDSSKNIDVGNITAKSLTLTSGISIENGGTGAVSAKSARVNLLVNGTNPITSSDQDIATYWGGLGGVSVSYFNKTEQISEQPTQYGLLLNCSYQTNSSISFQIWGTPTGTMYCRGSNSSGLSSWSKVLTEDNFASTISLSSLGGVSYTEVADLESLL